VYEEFVDSFGGGGGAQGDQRGPGGGGGGGPSSGGAAAADGPKVFLRGGTVLPGSRQTEPGGRSGCAGPRAVRAEGACAAVCMPEAERGRLKGASCHCYAWAAVKTLRQLPF